MTTETTYTDDGIEQLPLKRFAEKAYLNYSMYVILDRALPHIGDGLKPVQRRIIYAMSELGLNSIAKHKKSARTVGDVLGKFHPHGETACYEAMVLMAQSFSYRYPLIDGQGNWGAPDDPKSFAAMRYTESRLSAFSHLLLDELGQGTVDWKPSFDGTLEEPVVLSSRVPTVLLNGAAGIAVGMATDIPPHNLIEAVNACIYLIEKPKATIEELCEHIQGPDYPGGGELITPVKDLITLYSTGYGSVRLRATWHLHQGDVIVETLPYQVSGSKVMEQIAQQIRSKKMPWIDDLRDESDHEHPIRIVIVPRSNRVDVKRMMSHLFATTDLERSYRVNLNMIGTNGKPEVKDLRLLLKEWLAFRFSTVKRRLSHRLEKVEKRLHLLDALLIVFLNIDEVIRIIRTEDKPKQELIRRFNLSEIQASYILDTRLRQLARLEEMKIHTEQQELQDERASLQKILGSKQRMKTLIRKELVADAKKYGDERRTQIVTRSPAQAIDETEMLPSEPMTVILSEKGWVRAAKGVEVDGKGLLYKSGDTYLSSVPMRSNQQAVFIDSSGRSYSLAAHTLPSARGHGEPLTGRLAPPTGSAFIAVISGEADRWYLLSSSAGYGFRVQSSDLLANKKGGKSVLSLPKGASVMAPAPLYSDTDLLVAITNDGRMLVFPVSELPVLSRGKGNKIIGINQKKDEKLIALGVVPQGATLIAWSGKRYLNLKESDLKAYLGERGRRGKKLPRGFQSISHLKLELNT